MLQFLKNWKMKLKLYTTNSYLLVICLKVIAKKFSFNKISITFRIFVFIVHNNFPLEGTDIIDYIISKLSKERSRKQVLRELKSLGLNTFGLKAKKKSVFFLFIFLAIVFFLNHYFEPFIIFSVASRKSATFNSKIFDLMHKLAEEYAFMNSDDFPGVAIFVILFSKFF